MRTTGLLIGAGICVFVMSCAPRPRASVVGQSSSPSGASVAVPKALPTLLGKWLTPSGGTIEFKADGSAIMAGPLGSRDVTYRQPDERTIEFTKPGGTATVKWKVVSLGTEELVIIDMKGDKVHLRRGG